MKCPSEHLLSINKFTISNPITHIPPPTIFLPRHRCPVSMSPCPRSMHVALSSGFPFMQLRMLITGHQTRCLQSSFGLQKWHHSLGVFYLISSRTHLQSCSVVCRCRLCVGHPLAAFSLEPHREMLDWEPEYHSPCTLHAAFQTPAPSSHRAHGHRQHETSFLAAQLCNKETLSFVFSCR